MSIVMPVIVDFFVIVLSPLTSAVHIGKLIGATHVLVGSVDKLVKEYQVNTRIVKVETGEVQFTGYETFPADAFEEEAKSYLNLVPSSQVLGIYAMYNYNLGSSPLSKTIPNPINTIEADLHEVNLHMAGGGIKYYPTSSIWRFPSGKALAPLISTIKPCRAIRQHTSCSWNPDSCR